MPPKWSKVPKDKEIIAGESITLECEADGFPAPTIKWKLPEKSKFYQIPEFREK